MLTDFFQSIINYIKGNYITSITANDIEISDTTKGVILKSANGTRWRLTVNNAGAPVFTSL